MVDSAATFPRDRRGEWVPEDLPKPSPAFSRPWRIERALNVVFGFEGILGWQVADLHRPDGGELAVPDP